MFRLARCQWLTPIILATQEVEIKIKVEIRRIMVRANSSRDPTSKLSTEKGLAEWLMV
jgi:hypothetical protein